MTSLRQQIKKHFSQWQENLYCQDPAWKQLQFENAYLELRGKENRLYPDDVVRRLPRYTGDDRLAGEWKLREQSMQKILKYLGSRSSSGTILEIGCGNGWLSNQLARHTGREVLGVDINKTEIQQAARLFNDSPNLTFLLGEFTAVALLERRFDAIILASSIQYFENIDKLIDTLLRMITDNGEIHIVDSPIYSQDEIRRARERSEKYFRNLDSNLEAFYFHHSWNSFEKFKLSIRYKPSIFSGFWKKFGVRILPFPWLVIRK